MTRQQPPLASPRRPGYAPPAPGSRPSSNSSASLHLAQLDEMDDYELADGEPDIRGWEIRAVDGRTIGEVSGLLVDTKELKVRYVELTLESELAIDDDHRHAILPIGTARLDEDDDKMIVTLRADVFRTLPPYTRGQLSREHERELMNRLVESLNDTSVSQPSAGADFYDSAYFDDQHPFATRRAREGRSGASTSYFRRS